MVSQGNWLQIGRRPAVWPTKNETRGCARSGSPVSRTEEAAPRVAVIPRQTVISRQAFADPGKRSAIVCLSRKNVKQRSGEDQFSRENSSVADAEQAGRPCQPVDCCHPADCRQARDCCQPADCRSEVKSLRRRRCVNVSNSSAQALRAAANPRGVTLPARR